MGADISNPPDRRREGSVHLIFWRKAVAEFDGFVTGRGIKHAGNEQLVLGGFDAAGAVNEDAAGFEDAEAVFQQLRLRFHLSGDV